MVRKLEVPNLDMDKVMKKLSSSENNEVISKYVEPGKIIPDNAKIAWGMAQRDKLKDQEKRKANRKRRHYLHGNTADDPLEIDDES